MQILQEMKRDDDARKRLDEARARFPESSELAVLDETGTPARGSVPSFATPERAVIALAKVAEYARWRRRPSTPRSQI